MFVARLSRLIDAAVDSARQPGLAENNQFIRTRTYE